MFCLRVCLCATFLHGGRRGQKRGLDPLELELQMSVNCLGYAAVKLTASERALSRPDHWAISLAPGSRFLKSKIFRSGRQTATTLYTITELFLFCLAITWKVARSMKENFRKPQIPLCLKLAFPTPSQLRTPLRWEFINVLLVVKCFL